jgi:hypothetical protein
MESVLEQIEALTDEERSYLMIWCARWHPAMAGEALRELATVREIYPDIAAVLAGMKGHR